MTKGFGRRVIAGLGVVLAVWLVGPALPLLGVLDVCAAVVLIALGRR